MACPRKRMYSFRAAEKAAIYIKTKAVFVIFHLVNAQHNANFKPFPPVVPLAGGLPFNSIGLAAPFAVAPIAAPLPYQAVNVARSSFLWDAVTAGYCSLSAMAALPALGPADRRRLRRTAAARAVYLTSAYSMPAGDGPVRMPHYNSIEASEKGVLSFFVGQAVALRQTKLIWGPLYGVRRLYHRSLYRGVPGIFVGGGPSPDYLCSLNIGGVDTIGVVEAKGRGEVFDPSVSPRNREKLNDWFQQCNGIGFIPAIAAVSVACAGPPGLPGVVVGQFWDPIIENFDALDAIAREILLAKYFLRLFGFLNLFERDPARDGLVVWHCNEIGFNIGMSEAQFNALHALQQAPDGVHAFCEFLDAQDDMPEAQTRLDDREAIRNLDGLILCLNNDFVAD